MEKWWVVFLFAYLLPLLQIILAVLIRVFPPKFQNGVYGFYSSRSARNEKTWIDAQKKFAEVNLKCGIGILALAILFHNVIPINITLSNLINVLLGLASFVCSYIVVEKSLKDR